ncbi:acylphosphatase-1 [Folsomia candida]|uniref:Acylphosphatase n=1 Tax=Folsomia candida TaxID=158441 RepID=A0A226DPT3_FOLCA|nr:acylphosphatase-1 [Folsomia candida]XP_021960065.1 acylphosphatase-1 [Folsomia candida]OXA47090.1 Acylphosphatase-1 [Folsomia candida]
MSSSSSSEEGLVRVDFKVFGRVQGVFFRKFTQKEGRTLGLRGYCRNTSEGTVAGVLEGPIAKVEQMKGWLQTVGSPQSRIDRAEFSLATPIPDYSFKGLFGIERTL